jgi:16S rRNA (guanine527-N7)-methyltransferase
MALENLRSKLESANLEFDDIFYERCKKFQSLLKQWGAIHNLSAQLQDNQIEDNIFDSIYPLNFLNSFESLIDIGTGAGYPGMILAIARPEAQIVLCEPKSKRVAFLNFVKNTLELPNVEVVQNRVENLPPKAYDLITSRAVTNTSLLMSMTENLVDNDTEYLFYKGSMCDEEIKELEFDNFEVIKYGETRNYLYIKRKGLFDAI